MKQIIILVLALLTLASCKEVKKEEPKKEKIAYVSFGEKITPDNAISKAEMLTKFKNMKKGDTIDVKFASKISSVCKKKGCWMNLELEGEDEAFVRFKDYGFFMPLNADDREVIVNGKAYIDVVSVEELKHYAKDAGDSEEEINKITEEEVTYAIRSNGVLMVE